MVNAGLVGITVVDDYLAEFWSQIFTDINVQTGVTLRTGAELALAFRKNSPRLEAEVNQFIRRHAFGTEFGNITARRYLQNTEFASRATTGEGRRNFEALKDLFRKYGDRYTLDYLLMMAKGYQESRLDQNVRSRVGAIGIMQLMPATGRSLNVGDIRQVEPNIHAGVKYSRQLMDEYLGNEPLDDLNKGFLTLASYNAGPTRIRQLRREAERRGLDPNLWFGHVERIAADRIGRETVSYVANIYKYLHRLSAGRRGRRAAGRPAREIEEARRARATTAFVIRAIAEALPKAEGGHLRTNETLSSLQAVMNSANERQRVSLASGAGHRAPASEPVGESEGRSPSDKTRFRTETAKARGSRSRSARSP